MRFPCYHRSLCAALHEEPTVGWLMDLCDENYRQLINLAPGLRRLTGHHISRQEGCMDLHLEIREQTPYTTLVHITYFFSGPEQRQRDPDALLRVYHDSRQVEVIDLRQHILPLNGGRLLPTLVQKWRINLFLSKWLSYCNDQGHRFNTGSMQDPERPERLNLAGSW
ncbi:MAG: DUF1249 domain-containing protein [Gammaproteobacteria bacterium]|nr:DUF1249 domain-containing protein [Gammaproteobacteria bacterium]